MKTLSKGAISPLMQDKEKRQGATARLVGVISKARAREWIKHIKGTRKDWN